MTHLACEREVIARAVLKCYIIHFCASLAIRKKIAKETFTKACVRHSWIFKIIFCWKEDTFEEAFVIYLFFI